MTAVRLGWASLISASVFSILVLMAATSERETCTANSDGVTECVVNSQTLVEQEGAWILIILIVPIALTGLGLYAIKHRFEKRIEWAIAGLFLTLCIISILSIGSFFIIPAILLLIAVAKDKRPEQEELPA